MGAELGVKDYSKGSGISVVTNHRNFSEYFAALNKEEGSDLRWFSV